MAEVLAMCSEPQRRSALWANQIINKQVNISYWHLIAIKAAWSLVVELLTALDFAPSCHVQGGHSVILGEERPSKCVPLDRIPLGGEGNCCVSARLAKPIRLAPQPPQLFPGHVRRSCSCLCSMACSRGRCPECL